MPKKTSKNSFLKYLFILLAIINFVQGGLILFGGESAELFNSSIIQLVLGIVLVYLGTSMETCLKKCPNVMKVALLITMGPEIVIQFFEGRYWVSVVILLIILYAVKKIEKIVEKNSKK